MWTDFFDKIYVVNLAKRTDRMQQAKEQLEKYNIPFERFEAVEDSDGAKGLLFTMQMIFQNAINSNYKNILVFEDDLDIIEPTINEVMEDVIKDLPPKYEIIFLGCQLCRIPTQWYGNNLLNVQSAFATHAAMYSLAGIKKIMSRNFFFPIDNSIVQQIQPDGNCYATYPILVSQIVTKSDIYTSETVMDWKKYLEVKYWNRIQLMKESGYFNNNAKIYNDGK